jgi:predicted GNAT family acetyltransferase
VAQGLVDMVVSLARKAGVKIVPFCSYAKKLFATEQKYKDIVK